MDSATLSDSGPYPSVIPVHHVEAVDEPNRVWKSTGNDPAFEIRLPVFRPRYLLIEVAGHSHLLSPRLYFDFGRGFSERDSLQAAPGESLCLALDVGKFGFLRSIRLDPYDDAGATFTCTATAFHSRTAIASMQAWQKGNVNGRPEWVGPIGVFWWVSQRLSRLAINAAANSTLAAHLDSVYALAERDVPAVMPAASTTPWLSIVVPTYDTPLRYLEDLHRSILRQKAGSIELIFSDDASPSRTTREWLRARQDAGDAKVIFNVLNGGIAKAINAGLAQSTGEWVTVLDHDDMVAPGALSVVHRALLARPETQFLYTDEVVVNRQLKPRGLMSKPAYDPVLLTGMNYINHFSFYRRRRLEALGRLRDGFQGSQDYDMVLRYLEGLKDGEILHLPYPAYWWRRDGKTFSACHLDKATAAARRALSDHFRRCGKDAQILEALTPSLHKATFARPAQQPRISVIIPSKNALRLISTVLTGLLKETDYAELEILVIDNGTDDPGVLSLYEKLSAAHSNLHVHHQFEPFNFSRAVNRGLALATGRHFLLLNNDISIIHPNWLTEMVGCLNYDRAGIIGAKLLYPDRTIQHAGVVTGFGGLAGHWFLGKNAEFGGPMNRLHVRASMTCVTAAAMLISGECRAAIGDMDETNFAIAYNDVDYCLRAHAKGFRTLWTPFATLVHHESATRGSDKTLQNRVRFENEKRNLRRIHGTENFVDPASSPFYSRDKSAPTLTRLSELPQPRAWFGTEPSETDPARDSLPRYPA